MICVELAAILSMLFFHVFSISCNYCRLLRFHGCGLTSNVYSEIVTGLEEVCNGQLGLKWRHVRGTDDLGSSLVRIDITMPMQQAAKLYLLNHTTVVGMVCLCCGLAV